MNSPSTTVHNKRLKIILLSAAILLTIPLIAMQFTRDVDWKATDFAIMGILLVGTGLLCGFIVRKAKTTTQRVILCGIVLLAFLLVWAELAVGIVGTPFAGS